MVVLDIAEDGFNLLSWLNAHPETRVLHVRRPHRVAVVDQGDDEHRVLQSLRLSHAPHALFLTQLLDNLDKLLHRSLTMLVLDHLNVDKLRLPPNLQCNLVTLDLSHNKIERLSHVFDDNNNVWNLSKLALNTNKLSVLDAHLPNNLTVLLLSDNRLFSLSGLEKLVNLNVLDVSFNLIDRFDSMHALCSMAKLKSLDFRGNPITMHKEYRFRVLEHMNVAVRRQFRPLLDKRIIVPREKRHIGKIACHIVVSDDDNKNRKQHKNVESKDGEVSKEREESRDEDCVSQMSMDMSEATRTSSTAKGRLVAIAEPEEERELTNNKKETTAATLSPQKHKEYLETRQQVAELQAVFGKDNWLHSEAGAVMQRVLNIDADEQRWTSAARRVADARDKQKDIEKFVEHAANSIGHNSSNDDGSTNKNDDFKQDDFNEDSTLNDTSTTDDHLLYTTVTETSKASLNLAEDNLERKESDNLKAAVEPCSPESRRSSSFHSLYEKESNDGSVDEEQLEGEVDAVLDVMSDEYSENDEDLELRLRMTTSGYCSLETTNGQIKDTWFTHRIEQCDTSKYFTENDNNSPIFSVTLVISTSNGTSKRLVLRMDESTHSLFRAKIDSVLKEHQENALEMGAMQCVKCALQFTFEKDPHKRHDRPACPSCGSRMVVELEAAPTPSTNLTKSAVMTSTPVKRHQPLNSHELSSSLNSRQKASSQLLNFDEQQLRHSASSSDISVISNPSQSSIEVLNHTEQVQQQPYVAAELRTSAVTPVTVDKDAVDVAAKMMESSSSGSMTDSVRVTAATESTLTPAEESAETLEESAEALEESAEALEESSFETALQSPASPGYTTCTSDNDTTLDEGSSLASFLPAAGLRTVELLSKVTTPLSSNVFRHLTPNVPEAQPAPKRDVNPNIFEWDADNSFKNIDHRLKLFCDLSLCNELNETVLMAAKGEVFWHGTANACTGIVMVSNAKIYVLRFVTSTSSDPEQCLHLLDAMSLRNVRQVRKLLGGQGLEIETSNATPTTTVSSMVSNVVHAGTTSKLGLVLGDCGRVDLFVSEFREILEQNVAKNVTKFTTREESEETRSLSRHIRNAKTIFAVIFARLKQDDSTRGLFVLVSSLALYLIGNLLEWTLRQTFGQLDVLHTLRIDDIANIELSDAFPSRLEIRFFNRAPLQLLFETERSLDALVSALRHAFQLEHLDRPFEQLLTFYLVEEDAVLSMHALGPVDADNDAQWVQVLKRRRTMHRSFIADKKSKSRTNKKNEKRSN